MTPAELDEIEARANAATPGPWDYGRPLDGVGYFIHRDDGADKGNLTDLHARLSENDAAFIAHAREDIPALLAEVRRLRAAMVEAMACEEHIIECGCWRGTIGAALSEP